MIDLIIPIVLLIVIISFFFDTKNYYSVLRNERKGTFVISEYYGELIIWKFVLQRLFHNKEELTFFLVLNEGTIQDYQPFRKIRKELMQSKCTKHKLFMDDCMEFMKEELTKTHPELFL